jgi:hypothetical protein
MLQVTISLSASTPDMLQVTISLSASTPDMLQVTTAASSLVKSVGAFACLVFQKTCSPVQMDQSRNQYRPYECDKAPP